MAESDLLVEGLLRLSRLVRQYTHLARRPEMTVEQYWLLKRVLRVGPVSVGVLAEGLGLTSASVTVACKRLEKAGLLRRERGSDLDDERVVLVSLTEPGRMQLEAWENERRGHLTRLLAPLDDEEKAQLLRLLERVLEPTEMSLGVKGLSTNSCSKLGWIDLSW